MTCVNHMACFYNILCSSLSIQTRLQARLLGFNSRQGKWWDFFSSPPRRDRL